MKLSDILKSLKLNAIGAGDYLKCRCPFHHGSSGRTMWISTETGHWGCWSSRCQYHPVGGSLAELLVLRGWEWRDAVSIEASCSFEKLERKVLPRHHIREPHLVLWQVDWDLAEQVLSDVERSGRGVSHAHLPLYQWCYTNVRPGMVEHDYWFQLQWIMKTRGASAEALATMGVGWAPEHRAFSFPMRDPIGKLLGWAKRDPFNAGYYVSGTHLPKGHPDWELTYVDKGECLWGASELSDRVAAGEPIYLCEGYLDQLRILSCGYVAMAMQGKSLTEQQMVYINSIKNPVILWPDNDKDGLLAARKLTASMLHRENFSVVSNFFGVKDAGEMNKFALQVAATTAVTGFKFLINWSNYLAELSP